MKKSELNDLKLADLDDMISENQTKLQNLRFQKALQQLEDPLEIRSLKKEIAFENLMNQARCIQCQILI